MSVAEHPGTESASEVGRLRTLYWLLAALSEANALEDVYDVALTSLLNATGADRARTAGTPARPVRVLVVDDEPQIVRALKVVLREAGFEAVPAETTSQALDLAALSPPGAAIVDLVLPDGDGIELTRTLREWSEMPILVLSAIGEEEQKVRALEAGADDYVTKPFGARELVARLQAALRRTSCCVTRRRSTSPRSSSSCCACWCATAGA